MKTLYPRHTTFVAKELHDFLRPFAKMLSRPKQKKVFSIIKGMVQGRTVQLTNMGRALKEKILPKTFCEKLGKTLAGIYLLREIHMRKNLRSSFQYFIIDESDAQRKYAKKIEGIAKVRDGSTGELYGQGYPLIAVVGVTKQGKYIPFILKRYEEIQRGRRECVEEVLKWLGPDHGATWILDRGFDDKKFMEFLLEREQEFLIRCDRKKGERHLEVDTVEGKQKYLVSELTAHMGEIGYRRARLPGRTEDLTLIHQQHGKKEPLALLTTLTPRGRKHARKIAEIYFKRWKVEEYLRFIKQHFHLEKIMLQDIARVDGMFTMILIASSFVMEQMHEIMKSIFKASFRYWARREQSRISWSSVARFFQLLFESWQLTFRLRQNPMDRLQLSLFH